MGKQHKPHEKRFRPLSEGEIEQYDKVAQTSSDPLTELTARTLLHTGLRTGEFTHLRNNWLTSVNGGDCKILHVPGKEECIGGAGAVGRSYFGGNSSPDRSAACYTCRNERGGHWEPKRQTSIRKIQIIEEEVYELLKGWFEIHDQIPLLHGDIDTRLQHVAGRAELSRQVKPRDLRHTYGMMLARKGIDPHSITRLMGHQSLDMPFDRLYREAPDEFQNAWKDEDSESDSDSTQ